MWKAIVWEKALSLDSTHHTVSVWEGLDEGLALVEYSEVENS